MAETETFRLNIGVLRSQMSLQIHTHQASRLWHGRRPVEGKPGILGLNGFLSITNRINIGSRQDDPYSDWWMIKIEQKIDQVNAHLKEIRDEIEQVFVSVPASFTLGENLNVQPATLPVFAGSHLGYLAIYVLAQYDEIVRKAMLAHHIALIDRNGFDYWINHGDHQLRSLFALAQQYRYSGTTRKDFIEGNAVAKTALEKFGTVPADILNGSRRSRFSPPLRTGIEGDDAGEDLTDIQDNNVSLELIAPVQPGFDKRVVGEGEAGQEKSGALDE